MKYSVIISIVSALIFFVFPQSATANVDVNISNSTNGSNSHVEVHNSTSTNVVSNSSGSTVSNHICIETNGKQNCYDSDKPENINMHSDDGHTSVHVDNTTNSTANPTVIVPTVEQPTITIDPSVQQKIDDAKKNADALKAKAHEQAKKQKSWFETFMQQEMDSLHKLFGSLFK